MNSSINFAILIVCVGFFAARAYKKGIWQALFGLLGLFVAYLFGFFLTPPLFEALQPFGAQGLIGLMVILVVMFMMISWTVSQIPLWIWPAFKDTSTRQRFAGAAMGGFTGALLAMVLIWLLSMLTALTDTRRAGSGLSSPSPGFLSNAASSLMSKAIEAGVSALQDDEFVASTTAGFLKAPEVYAESVAGLAESRVFNDFWMNDRMKFFMAEGEVDNIVASQPFRQLVDRPEMQRILALSKPKQYSQAQAEYYLASHMSFVHQRMRTLRHDQRVIDILEDEEVKALVRDQDTFALLAHPKIQTLVSIVMEEGAPESADNVVPESMRGHEEDSAAHQTLEKIDSFQTEEQSESENEPTAMYKWQDDEGQVQYSDWENVPREKRTEAEEIKGF